MFKFAVVIFAVVIASAAAKPGLISAPLAYTAPAAAVVAAPSPLVTATSNQVIARNFNGIATAPVVAPVAAPFVSRTVTAYNAPIVAKPVAPVAFAAPLAYPGSLVAKYTAAPFAYTAPLNYAAAPAPVLL